MSRWSNDHHLAFEDAEAVTWRIGSRLAINDTQIFYHGTAGDDRLLGSNFDDYFDMSQGGDDAVDARGGDDVFYFGAAFTGADRVVGGDGSNVLILDGDYSAGITIGKHHISDVDLLGLNGGSFVITGALGSVRTVDATSLLPGQGLHLEASSAGFLQVLGGEGDDVVYGATNGRKSSLLGGDGDDALIGSGGRTYFVGGAGADLVRMTNLRDVVDFSEKSDSTASNYDLIDGFLTHASGAKNLIRLFLDSDDTTPGTQHNFHLGTTAGRIGDVVVHYDTAFGHTIVDVFTNADDTPDLVLHLNGDVPLAAADFYFFS